MSGGRLPRLPVAGDRDPSRAHWMELFFDLVFVALVGQLAHGLHAEPSFGTLAVFVALFASVWWSWVNLTFVVDVSPQLSRRRLSLVMLIAMFAVGALAVAAPEAVGDRAWLFAPGYGLRYAAAHEVETLPTWSAIHACAKPGTP